MDFEEKLAKRTQKHAFFYVTLDPERALGIEDVLANYTIICPYKSPLTEKLKKDGVDVVVLEENMPPKKVEEIVERGTYGMLRSKFVQDTINKICAALCAGSNPAHIMVLKNSALIEETCKKQGWKLLAPKASVAEKFENKISQYKLLGKSLPYPDSKIIMMDKIFLFPPTAPFVLQFNRGHSGNTTFFIKSKKDLDGLYKLFPRREAKISKYIKGKTYTLNCLLLKGGKTLTGSISKQITGLISATNNPNTTVGNDFTSARKLNRRIVREIRDIAHKAGREMHERGYVGLFGIDAIIEEDSGSVYFIELNTHQPAGVSFEAKLHRRAGKTPLLAHFISDALGKVRHRLAEPPIVLPIKAKQIIYRNKTNKIIKAISVKNTGLVSRMKFIKPNEELYRIQKYNNTTI